MIRIAITDDHPAITEGIKTMIGNAEGIHVTEVFPDGRTTLDKIGGDPPDVLLLDINLPDMDGLEVCREVLTRVPKLRIIAFTSYRETSLLRSILQYGGKGFLLKNSSYQEILEAILTVYHGGEYIQPEMKEILLNESLRRKPDQSFIPNLTRREKEILGLILEEYTTQQMAEKLYVSPKTIESHRLNLMQKLGVKNTAGLVKITMERGLLK